MKERDQVRHFQSEIERVIDRFKFEYRMSVASYVGVLYIIIDNILRDAYGRPKKRKT